MQHDNDYTDDLLVFQVPLRLTHNEIAKLLAVGPAMPRTAKATSIFHTGDVDIAKSLFKFEHRRRLMPGIEPFIGDPAWTILLDLFVRDAEGLATSVSSSTLASGAPPTTGLRYIVALEAKGYIERRRHPSDARSVLLSLTAEARSTIAALLRNMG